MKNFNEMKSEFGETGTGGGDQRIKIQISTGKCLNR